MNSFLNFSVSAFDWLVFWDYQIFHFINGGLEAAWLTNLMLFLSHVQKSFGFLFVFIPLVVLVGFWRFRWRWLKWLLAIGLAVGCADLFNYRVLKSLAGRSRPPQTQSVEAKIRVPNTPKDNSFPSNHAVNSMALATMLASLYPPAHIGFYAYALAVGASRVYLGVHFPLDVLMGWLVGFCFARIWIVQVYRRFKWWQWPNPKTHESTN